MDIKSVVDRVNLAVEPILSSLGLSLVETTFRSEGGRWVLRVAVHKRGGVTLDELGMVNQDLSAALDVDDAVPFRYNLEVSSPGLTRVLKEERDFGLFAGSLAQVTAREPGGGSLVLRGILEGVEEGKVLLREDPEEEGAEGLLHRIPLEDIAKARLDVEIKPPRPRSPSKGKGAGGSKERKEKKR